MSQMAVTFSRIYLHEGQHLLKAVLTLLHDEEQISGVTVLRGISGFGEHGEIHTASLVDLSIDLPLSIEFYDEPEKVIRVINRLQSEMGVRHIVSWAATSHLKNTN